MRFSICTGNHGSHGGLSDTVTFLQRALQDCGHDVRINADIRPDRINVVLEHFPDAASIRTLFDARSAGARFVIVGTEPMAAGTFNARLVRGHWHYGDADYWKRRHDHFVLACEFADAVWVLAESMVEPYRAALPGRTVLFLPHGWVEGFERYAHRPETEKDIDFHSSGTLTEHRRRVLDALVARGHQVVWDPLGVGDYLRHEHLSRARISLSLRLSPEHAIPSVSRLHFNLQHANYVLHERCALPCALDPYVLHLPPDEIVEWCEAALELADRRQTAEAVRARFRAQMPMSRLLPPILEASLPQLARAA